jgi:predicted membrane protein
MNLHFTICPLASVVLVLVILVNISDIYLVGTNLALFIINALFAVFIVWVANKTCFTRHWVSWFIVGFLVISVIGNLLVIFIPMFANDPKIKARLDKDRAEIAAAAGVNNDNKDEREGFLEGASCKKPKNGCCNGTSGPKCVKVGKNGCCP